MFHKEMLDMVWGVRQLSFHSGFLLVLFMCLVCSPLVDVFFLLQLLKQLK